MHRADFERATRLGQRGASQHFQLFLLLRPDGQAARLGITVTRRIGKAVRRNRIKRLVREWFRRRKGTLSACDLVVIAKRGFPRRLSAEEAARELDRGLERVPARAGSEGSRSP
jgi:ribonuclease P protein component